MESLLTGVSLVPLQVLTLTFRNLRVTLHLAPAGSSPVGARSLDDDDVVVVAPFDEEVAGEGPGSPEFPPLNRTLHAAEANHKHVGHHMAHSSSEPSRA